MADEIARALPADVLQRPVEQLSAPEALGRWALSGVRQLVRLVEEEIDPADIKQKRLIGDLSIAGAKLYVRVQEGEFRKQSTDTMTRLLEQALALGDVPAIEHEATPKKSSDK